MGQLTRAVATSIGNDGAGDIVTTGLLGAITDAEREVGVLAQAGRVVVRASERGAQGDHVVEAGLLEQCEPWRWEGLVGGSEAMKEGDWSEERGRGGRC
jgi:hypothetical protein